MQHAALKGLGRVAGVIQGLVQFGVDVRNVKPFEVVVHVEQPVGLNDVISIPPWVVDEGFGVQKTKSLIEPFPRRVRFAFNSREVQPHPSFQRKSAQVVGFTWEPDGLLKFRHVPQRAVEVERSSMVAALQCFFRARLRGQAHPTVRADVGEAGRLGTVDQQNGLTVDGFKVVERLYVVRFHLRDVCGELPPREDGLESIKFVPVRVVPRGERPCCSYVFIDQRLRHGLSTLAIVLRVGTHESGTFQRDASFQKPNAGMLIGPVQRLI